MAWFSESGVDSKLFVGSACLRARRSPGRFRIGGAEIGNTGLDIPGRDAAIAQARGPTRWSWFSESSMDSEVFVGSACLRACRSRQVPKWQRTKPHSSIGFFSAIHSLGIPLLRVAISTE